MWGPRPFRQLTVVLPPATVNLDPIRVEDAKQRFLENLWQVQARYRTRNGQSVLLSGDDRELENRDGTYTIARPYYNLYPRTSFMREPKKASTSCCYFGCSYLYCLQTKLVVHVDRTGAAAPVEFGPRGPFVVVRIQPLEGDFSRFSVSSLFQTDEGEEEIVHTETVAGRVVGLSAFGSLIGGCGADDVLQFITTGCSRSRREFLPTLPLRRQVRPAQDQTY